VKFHQKKGVFFKKIVVQLSTVLMSFWGAKIKK